MNRGRCGRMPCLRRPPHALITSSPHHLPPLRALRDLRGECPSPSASTSPPPPGIGPGRRGLLGTSAQLCPPGVGGGASADGWPSAGDRRSRADDRQTRADDRQRLRGDGQSVADDRRKLAGDRRRLRGEQATSSGDRPTLPDDRRRLGGDRQTLPDDRQSLCGERRGFPGDRQRHAVARPTPARARQAPVDDRPTLADARPIRLDDRRMRPGGRRTSSRDRQGRRPGRWNQRVRGHRRSPRLRSRKALPRRVFLQPRPARLTLAWTCGFPPGHPPLPLHLPYGRRQQGPPPRLLAARPPKLSDPYRPVRCNACSEEALPGNADSVARRPRAPQGGRGGSRGQSKNRPRPRGPSRSWLAKTFQLAFEGVCLPKRSGGRRVPARRARARSPRRGSAAPPRRSPGVRQARCSSLPLRKQPSERGNLPVSPHPFDWRRAPRFSLQAKSGVPAPMGLMRGR